jgi:hypothetical protein
MKDNDRKIIYIAVVISIILHLVGLLMINGFDLFAFSREEPPPEIAPLELEFEQPKVPEQQIAENLPEEKFYELVENPNATGQTPETSDKLSTASSLSQAPSIIPGQIREIPGQEVEKQASSQNQSEEDRQQLQEALEKSILAYKENRSFSRSALTGKKEPAPKVDESSEKGAERGESSQRPEGFDADLVGDFSLSTYEWEWAPYWLAFKRKLNRMWFAPPAYFMGLIHGHTILRFKVYRNGTIADLEILRHVGHESLEQSSFGAIEAVFPFLPLPENFPDEYLEVTLKLIYPDLRAYRISQNK